LKQSGEAAMPYKEKTPNGTVWRGAVMRQGHRKTQLFSTKAEATAWEADQKALPFDRFLTETPMVFSLAEWSETYLGHVKERYVKQTYQEKCLAFREFFELVKPTLEPSRLHPGVILTHFAKQAKQRSGNAANKDRNNLVAAWNWAIKYLPGWPESNPFPKTDKQESEEHPRYIPPAEDFWKVFDITTGQDQVMLIAYLHTAARKSEIFELAWSDVDFPCHRIRLWTRKRKGKREADWIPMTQELEEALKSWHENRTFKESAYVFNCEDKTPFCEAYYGKPFKRRYHWLKRLCEKASVPEFGLHAIRHLSASILDDKNYPLSSIQCLLRHKSASTTSKYIHKLRGFRAVLDEAFKRESLAPAATPAAQLLPGTQQGLPQVEQASAQDEKSRSEVGSSTKERPYLRLVRFR
jgi:integrase